MLRASPHAHTLLRGLAISAILGCALHSGGANAAIVCTFANLSACNGTLANLKFTNFALNPSSTGFETADTITLDVVGDTYTVEGTYRDPATGNFNRLTGNGSFSFTATTLPNFKFISAAADSTTVGSTFVFSNAVSGFSPSPIQSIGGSNPPPSTPSSSPLLSTNVTISWAADSDLANNSLLTFNLVDPPADVPAPLPALGTVAAYAAARRLRQRLRLQA